MRSEPVGCVLVGAKNPQQVQDHLGAVGITFSDEEIARIDALSAQAPQPE